MKENKRKRNVLLNFAKTVIVVGMVYFLIKRTDVSRLWSVIADSSPGFLMLVILCLLVEKIFMTARLYVALRLKDIHMPFLSILKYNFISIFVGIFLPTKLGVDAMRIFYISKYTGQTIHSFSSVALDRFINMTIITLFASTSYFFGGYIFSRQDLLIALVPMWAGIASVFIFMSKKLRTFIRGRVANIKFLKKIISWIGEVVRSFYEYNSYKRYILYLFFLALGFQLVRVAVVYFLARSLDMKVPFDYLFIFLPVVVILGMIPLSIAGIGITQGGIVYLFESIGISREEALGFSIMIYVLRLILNLPGLYFFYREGFDTIASSIARQETSS